MKKTLILFIFLLVIAVAALQLDDPLSGQARHFIAQTESTDQSPAFLYLTGLYANSTEAPEVIGKKMLKQYQAFEADQSDDISEYPDNEKISLPNGALFCGTWEEDCLPYLFSHEADIDTTLKAHAILLSRIETLHAFNEYKTLTKPLITEPVAPFHYVSRGERLLLLNAISAYKNGQPETALASLVDQITALRKMLVLQDNLIGKMVFVITLSEAMDVASVVLAQSDLEVPKIPRLSPQEKDFSKVVAREFAMLYYSLKDLNKTPEILELDSGFPTWMVRTFYKPNMTVNGRVPFYLRLEQLARSAPAEFVESIKSDVGASMPSWQSKVRNYIGSLVPSPEYDRYVGRLMDLDAKIVLFNHLQDGLEPVENPYYGNEIPETDGTKVCLRGPLEDERLIRCVRTRLSLWAAPADS